jgi:hypothetical protein
MARGIERGEHALLGKDMGIGQGVKQRRLTRVGVSGEGQGGQRYGGALLALQVARRADFLEILFELVDALADSPTVGFELRFAGASGADAAAKTGHLYAAAGQTRQ